MNKLIFKYLMLGGIGYSSGLTLSFAMHQATIWASILPFLAFVFSIIAAGYIISTIKDN